MGMMGMPVVGFLVRMYTEKTSSCDPPAMRALDPVQISFNPHSRTFDGCTQAV